MGESRVDCGLDRLGIGVLVGLGMIGESANTVSNHTRRVRAARRRRIETRHRSSGSLSNAHDSCYSTPVVPHPVVGIGRETRSRVVCTTTVVVIVSPWTTILLRLAVTRSTCNENRFY